MASEFSFPSLGQNRNLEKRNGKLMFHQQNKVLYSVKSIIWQYLNLNPPGVQSVTFYLQQN